MSATIRVGSGAARRSFELWFVKLKRPAQRSYLLAEREKSSRAGQNSHPMKGWNDLGGDWHGLMSPAQAQRYQAIAEAIERYCPAGSVLDVGCGEAVPRAYLPHSVEYTGIEPSALAVASARAKSKRGHIIHERCEDFELREQGWDWVVFNEVLYYLADPIGSITRYAQSVRRGGIVITSIFQKPESRSVKARLLHLLDNRRPFSNVHCTKLVCDFMSRHSWAIERNDLVPTLDGQQHWRVTVARPRA